ncbi:MAG TPA: universal stress protein [Solirubrobacteraceae bacterium]
MSPAKQPPAAAAKQSAKAATRAGRAGRKGGAERPCLVVGYDRTANSRHALDWAARRLGGAGKLVLVYACRPLHAPPSPLETAQERRAFAGAAIDELLLEASDALIDADVETEISDEDPVTALTDAARRHGAEAIVVGCEQHSRLHKAIGTVTSELLQHSPVAVTAVPSSAS